MWALVRASGTEPLIRIIIDADDARQGDAFFWELKTHISQSLPPAT